MRKKKSKRRNEWAGKKEKEKGAALEEGQVLLDLGVCKDQINLSFILQCFLKKIKYGVLPGSTEEAKASILGSLTAGRSLFWVYVTRNL